MILFQSEEIDFDLKNKRKVKTWLRAIAAAEGYKIGELSFIFMSDNSLLKVNVEYLNHDTYTDIITFDNSEEDGLIEGDIFISKDRVQENASTFEVDFDSELNRVMAHGLLHLCGYKDKSESQAKLMREKENWALSLL